MKQPPELALVMPVYNEAEIIEEVIDSWSSYLDGYNIHYEIHAYNDGSKDNTLKVLENIKNKYPRLVVHNKANSGHGPTILQAYNENTDADWIFQVDSDNEMKPDAFINLWEVRGDYDLLIGIRTNRNSPFPRKIVSFISRITVWIFYGKAVYDVNCPYRLMRSTFFATIFKSIPDVFFAPNVVLTGMAARNKARIFQLPVEYASRQTGTVSIKKWKLFKMSLKSFIQTCNFSFKSN